MRENIPPHNTPTALKKQLIILYKANKLLSSPDSSVAVDKWLLTSGVVDAASGFGGLGAVEYM